LLISKQNPIRAHTATKIRYFSDGLLAGIRLSRVGHFLAAIARHCSNKEMQRGGGRPRRGFATSANRRRRWRGRSFWSPAPEFVSEIETKQGQ
jgi:hypothetical protein